MDVLTEELARHGGSQVFNMVQRAAQRAGGRLPPHAVNAIAGAAALVAIDYSRERLTEFSQLVLDQVSQLPGYTQQGS